MKDIEKLLILKAMRRAILLKDDYNFERFERMNMSNQKLTRAEKLDLEMYLNLTVLKGGVL